MEIMEAAGPWLSPPVHVPRLSRRVKSPRSCDSSTGRYRRHSARSSGCCWASADDGPASALAARTESATVCTASRYSDPSCSREASDMSADAACTLQQPRGGGRSSGPGLSDEAGLGGAARQAGRLTGS